MTYRERERKREIVILYGYDYFLFSSFDWVTESTLADMWIFISGTKIGVKISQYYDFAPQQNRSLSFQFPKLYAIQMPAEVVNFQKQKEKVWLVHQAKKKQTTTAIYLYSIIIIFLIHRLLL